MSTATPRPAHAAPRTHAGLTTAPILLVASATASALFATDAFATGPRPFAAALGAIVLVIAVSAVCIYFRTGRSVRLVAVSPFAIASFTWIVLFVLRPLELYFFPDHAVLALGELGFDLEALTRTVGLAGVGCAAWCAAYIWALGRHPKRDFEPAPPSRAHWAGGAAAIVIGTALWVTLFMRHGGTAALLRSPVSVRADQRASSYGFVGLWIVQGAALCGLALLLQERRLKKRALRWIVAVAAVASLAAAVALELRGLALFALVSAVAIAVTLRPPSKAKVAAGVGLAAVAVVVLAYAQQVRAYTSRMTTPAAVRTAVHTPPWAVYVSDLGTFDQFVAMRQLVPASVPFLDGATIREIPEALVPRRLWPRKPLGVDARVAAYLYPGAQVAVPISLQGELYWNGGLIAVIIGSLVVGAGFGGLGRLGLTASPRSPWFVLYAVALPFTHAFLTRGLAAMTENLTFAVLGVSVACLAFGFAPESLRSRRRPAVRAPAAPSPVPERRGADAWPAGPPPPVPRRS